MILVPSRWLVRGLVALAAASLVIGWMGKQSLGARSDWLAFYAAGSFLLNGNISQIYNPTILQEWQAPLIGSFLVRYLYAPAYSLFFAPLALLPVEIAQYIWLGLGLLSGFAAVYKSNKWSGLGIGLGSLSLLAFPPFAFSLAVGQVSSLTLLLFTLLAKWEWDEEHGWIPGLTAGLLLFKPQLLIPIVFYWFFNKRWRTLIGMVISTVLITSLSYYISPKATTDYLQLSLSFFTLAEYATTSGANASFYAFTPWIGILVSISVLLILFIITRKGKDRYAHAMLWLSPILVTPYIVTYDLVLLALPVSFLVIPAWRDRIIQIAIVLILVTPLLAVFIQSIRPVTLTALGLFIICAWRFFNSTSQKNLVENEFGEPVRNSN